MSATPPRSGKLSDPRRGVSTVAEIHRRLLDAAAELERRPPTIQSEDALRILLAPPIARAGRAVIEAFDAKYLTSQDVGEGTTLLLHRRPKPLTDEWCAWFMMNPFGVFEELADTDPGDVHAGIGLLHHPACVTDAQGRPVGRDGKPLREVFQDSSGRVISKKALRRALAAKPATVARYGCFLDGEVATVLDAESPQRRMARLEVRANTYAAACRLLARRLASGSAPPHASAIDDGDASDPEDDLSSVLDLDPDGGYVLLDGKRVLTGSGSRERGGKLTPRHKGVKFLVALQCGARPPALGPSSRHDVRVVLRQSRKGAIELIPDGEGYRLSRPVVPTEALALACGFRPRRPSAPKP